VSSVNEWVQTAVAAQLVRSRLLHTQHEISLKYTMVASSSHVAAAVWSIVDGRAAVGRIFPAANYISVWPHQFSPSELSRLPGPAFNEYDTRERGSGDCSQEILPISSKRSSASLSYVVHVQKWNALAYGLRHNKKLSCLRGPRDSTCVCISRKSETRKQE